MSENSLLPDVATIDAIMETLRDHRPSLVPGFRTIIAERTSARSLLRCWQIATKQIIAMQQATLEEIGYE